MSLREMSFGEMAPIAQTFFDGLLGDKRSYDKVKELFSSTLQKTIKKKIKNHYFQPDVQIANRKTDRECMIRSSHVGKMLCKVDYIRMVNRLGIPENGFFTLSFCDEGERILIKDLSWQFD